MKTRRTFILSVATSAALVAAAGCGSPSGEETGNKTIKVVYLNENATVGPLDTVMKKAKAEFEEANPGMEVDLQPMKSSADDYFTKLALMSRSSSTAPDVMYEDSFQVKSDAAAGYLAPLDEQLEGWSDYDKYIDAAKLAGQGLDGKTYAVSLGTDTQGIWYRKDIFEQAGLPVPFKPTSWDDMLTAARQIKQKVPDVYPWQIYAGTQLAETGSLRGFQTFLTGTDDSLYDAEAEKWVLGSTGFRDTLDLIKTVYDEGLSAPPSVSLDPALGTTVSQTWLPEGKVAMVIDGSWQPNNWQEGGTAPWPEWEDKMGWVAIPTQDGQGPGSTSMSGGWTVAMGAKTANPDAAFGFMKTLLSEQNALEFNVEGSQIAVRSDVSSQPAYQDANPTVPLFTDLVEVTNFRPATPDYPQVSQQISVATDAVVNGTSPEEAQKAYDEVITGIVGEENTESSR